MAAGARGGCSSRTSRRVAFFGYPPDALVPIPSLCGINFISTASAPELTPPALAWLNASTEQEASASLEKRWDSVCEMIKHDDCPPITGPTYRFYGKCRKDICICCDPGRQVARRTSEFLVTLKKVCPRKSWNRALLEHSRLVVLLSGRLTRDDAVEEPLELWFHLGFTIFSPYCVTVHKLLRVPSLDEQPRNRARVYIQARYTSCNLYTHPRLGRWSQTVSFRSPVFGTF